MAELSGEHAAAAASAGLVAAVRRVLRPLVRLLIARSVSFPVASGLLRSLFVEVAVEEFPVEGKPQTDSRITLLTGVHRKDVKRLREQRHPALRPPRAASLGSQLIARWLTLAEYLDDGGQPRSLSRLPAAEDDHSFESLVRSINTDIRPRVVLDEWQRLGLVHVDDDDRVHLNVQGFIPAKGSDEMTYFFGRNLHDHAAAAVSNMLGDAAPFLERSVNYGGLSRAAVDELTDLAQRKGGELLRELNARALRLQQRDAKKADASHRANVGLYVFAEDRAGSDTEESES